MSLGGGVLPESYSLEHSVTSHRNPWRVTPDPLTGLGHLGTCPTQQLLTKARPRNMLWCGSIPCTAEPTAQGSDPNSLLYRERL